MMNKTVIQLFLSIVVGLFFIACGQAQAAADSPREEVSLNGLWDFYPEGGTTKHPIRVPSFWDAPQDYGYPQEWLHMRHGIYRKTLPISPSMKDKQVFLRIEQVSVIAQVRINGQQVGAEDSGGYLMLQLPYLIDLTAHLKWDADNSLEVAVWGGKSMIHGTDSQDALKKEKDFPADTLSDGNFLYPFCVDHWDGRRGINGDVSLVTHPKLRVSDAFIIPDLHKNSNPADDEITLRVTLTNHDGKTRTAKLTNVVLGADGKPALEFAAEKVVLGGGGWLEVIVPAVSWTHAAYWWPHDPQLYTLVTTVEENDKPVDILRTRFGFRQFYVKGGHYELNGIRANLRGDAYEFSWHEGFRHGPSTAPVFSTKELIPSLQERLVREYQKLNHNVLRPHKTSAYRGLYNTCDELGMMVIDEAPFWEVFARTDERSRPNYEAWVRRWVKERRNHPSIVAWVAANETWYGSIAQYSIQTARSVDPTRPVFHDDPFGPNRGKPDQVATAGDEDCYHYTGGYPMTALSSNSLYDIYRVNPARPTGEGEALFPDGWPLMNPDGTLNGLKRSERGQFGHPDMISQANWVRAVGRVVRAMRYAGLSDIRPYANWMYAFDPIEADLPLEWSDLSAPGIKPTLLHRPILNVFTDHYPAVRYNPGRDYYRNCFAPVAVFDKEADRQNRIGVAPLVFKSGEILNRTLIAYNDEFTGGDEIQVQWRAEAFDPQTGESRLLGEGNQSVRVPYGEFREQAATLTLPADLPSGKWLHWTLSASKNGQAKFQDTIRLGALVAVPGAKLKVEPAILDMGTLRSGDAAQWHVVRLVNIGGGASELWTLSGMGDGLEFNTVQGNLRSEQEIYCRVQPKTIPAGTTQRKLRITGASGATAELEVHFKIVP